jgi:hypothetical protein
MNLLTETTDDLMLDILTTAAHAIVRRERVTAARVRVRYSPAAAIDHANAISSRESFILGMPSDDDARRALRATLIADALNA